jgi:hypothetical protein
LYRSPVREETIAVRAVVHIGPHKTGTTHLQQVFQALRPALRQCGIAFPAAWSQSQDQPSHQRLADALRAGDSGSLDPVEDCDCLLISAEDLSLLETPQIQALRGFLGDRDVTIVFHSRRWSDILPAVWQERIKHGFCETLPDFVTAVLADPERIGYVGFGAVLDRYAAVFGAAAIRIVCYNHVPDLARHFVRTFLPDAGPLLDTAGPRLNAWPNRSLPFEQIEMVRVLNVIHQRNGGTRGPEMREWFLRTERRLDISAIVDGIGAHSKTLSLADDEPTLASLHRRLWAAYASHVTDPHPEQGFFVPANRAIPFADQAYLTDPAIQQQFWALYRAFRAI